jgi:catechol 2,3-dioxygenase-like lactoylglutathione lyase family enzyme
MTYLRLQHVSVPIPVGSQETARQFYGGLLGLAEKRPPKSLADMNLIWYEVSAVEGELELHLFPDTELTTDPYAAHFCLNVSDLEEKRRAFEQVGLTIVDAPSIPSRPRFFIQDPFNNRIEFTRIEGNYREAE